MKQIKILGVHRNLKPPPLKWCPVCLQQQNRETRKSMRAYVAGKFARRALRRAESLDEVVQHLSDGRLRFRTGTVEQVLQTRLQLLVLVVLLVADTNTNKHTLQLSPAMCVYHQLPPAQMTLKPYAEVNTEKLPVELFGCEQKPLTLLWHEPCGMADENVRDAICQRPQWCWQRQHRKMGIYVDTLGLLFVYTGVLYLFPFLQYDNNILHMPGKSHANLGANGRLVATWYQHAKMTLSMMVSYKSMV